MIICQCEAVSDRAIRKAVRKGADSLTSVGDMCGAGTGCGGCLPEIERLLGSDQPVRLLGLAT